MWIFFFLSFSVVLCSRSCSVPFCSFYKPISICSDLIKRLIVVEVPVGTSVVDNDDDCDGLNEHLPSTVGSIDSDGDCDDDCECLERKDRESCEHAFI
jgi:hypothetical protein